MKIKITRCTLKHLALLACCIFWIKTNAQTDPSKNNFLLSVRFSDKDSSFTPADFKLRNSFSGEAELVSYLYSIPALLATKGYPVASLDSTWKKDNITYASIYLGTKYNWVQLISSNVEAKALDESGYREKNFLNKPFNLVQVQLLQERLLNYYEKTGYPFAAVYLDSVSINNDKISAALQVNKGTLYHIDSIRVIGKARLNTKFLQHYLYISNGSIYNKDRLSEVDKRLTELNFVKPTRASDLTMLGTGAILNLYLQPKKSSQVNFIVGFLPAGNNSKKLQLTGDVNLDLKNMLTGGESILIKWQQLQPKSPRLNLGFNQPYIFNSPFGFDFLFDLFKKDSSFLQLNAQLGVQYLLAPGKTGKIFIQWQNNSLLSGGVDTNQVIAQKKLPPNIDVRAVNIGLNYDWNKTNYKLNPRSGNEINILTTVGVKRIKKNSDITGIKDPGFNYASLYDSIKPKSYQLRIKLSGAHYFPLGKLSTVKTAVSTGMYTSPDIFRNELFQIGGYKLLRGFDEESIYATRYAIGSLEYHYLIDLNSYLFTFIDYGLTKNKYQQVNVNNNFLGVGLGIVYEAKLGVINISYAIGKRNDVAFNLREASKLHFGYVNYF